MYGNRISIGEVIGGILFLGLLVVCGIAISNKVRESMDRDYLKYQQALKTENRDEFAYGIKTDVGNILVYGEVKALEPQSFPEIDGKYSIIKRVEQHWTKHSRQVSYDCGTTESPQTCWRTEDYHSWDTVKETKLSTKGYTVLGTSIPFLCPAPVGSISLGLHYKGDKKHDDRYVYPKTWFLGNGDDRIYYEGLEESFPATVFLRAFSGVISDPLGKSCLPLYYRESMGNVLERVKPNYYITNVLIGIAIIALSVGYIAAAEQT